MAEIDAYLQEIRKQNQKAVREAFDDLGKKIDRAFRSDTETGKISAVESDPILLMNQEGTSRRYRLHLKEMRLSDNAPQPLIQLLDESGTMVGYGDFIPKNVYSGEGKSKRFGVEYTSALYLEDPSIKGMGLGSEMSRSGEALFFRIWKHWQVAGEQDFLRLVIVDDSVPKGWTSRRAQELGYVPAGEENGNPKFEKTISYRSEPIIDKLHTLLRRKKS